MKGQRSHAASHGGSRSRKKDWSSLLKKNRNLETNSFVLNDVAGKRLPLLGPHIGVADLILLILPTAYRAVTVWETTYWPFTLAERIAGLGKVRRVLSCESAELTETYAVLVTNRVDWSAQRIIALYLHAGRSKPFIRIVKPIWAWTSTACGTLKPLGNIGV